MNPPGRWRPLSGPAWLGSRLALAFPSASLPWPLLVRFLFPMAPWALAGARAPRRLAAAAAGATRPDAAPLAAGGSAACARPLGPARGPAPDAPLARARLRPAVFTVLAGSGAGLAGAPSRTGFPCAAACLICWHHSPGTPARWPVPWTPHALRFPRALTDAANSRAGLHIVRRPSPPAFPPGSHRCLPPHRPGSVHKLSCTSSESQILLIRGCPYPSPPACEGGPPLPCRPVIRPLALATKAGRTSAASGPCRDLLPLLGPGGSQS